MTKSNGNASDLQRKLAAALPPDEPVAGSHEQPESIPPRALLAQVLDRTNLQRALKQVRRNQGAPGIDGMSVDELPEYLKHHWPDIRAQLESGHYRPNRPSGWTSRKGTVSPVLWGYRQCWTGSSSKPSRKS